MGFKKLKRTFNLKHATSKKETTHYSSNGLTKISNKLRYYTSKYRNMSFIGINKRG